MLVKASTAGALTVRSGSPGSEDQSTDACADLIACISAAIVLGIAVMIVVLATARRLRRVDPDIPLSCDETIRRR